MKKERLLGCFVVMGMLLPISGCSAKKQDRVKVGIYKSKVSDSTIEILEDNKLRISNIDLTETEEVLEKAYISFLKLSDEKTEEFKELFDLNRDFVGKEVSYNPDNSMFETDGSIALKLATFTGEDGRSISYQVNCFPANDELSIGYAVGDELQELYFTKQ